MFTYLLTYLLVAYLVLRVDIFCSNLCNKHLCDLQIRGRPGIPGL